MRRFVAPLLTCLILAACAPAGGSTRADPATQEACRVQADRIYDAQHRADIFTPMAGVNSPSSGFYQSSSDGRGLSQIFVRDTMIQDCVRRGVAPEPTQR